VLDNSQIWPITTKHKKEQYKLFNIIIIIIIINFVSYLISGGLAFIISKNTNFDNHAPMLFRKINITSVSQTRAAVAQAV
jgi:hypothetical protein